jgi:hypothetical protein
MIKHFVQKQLIKISYFISYGVVLTHEEKTGDEKISTSIVRRLINHPDSKFVVSSLSQKRYIKNNTLNLFVTLLDRQIGITNHIYHYDVFVSLRDWNKIKKQYDLKNEEITLEYEKQIKSQITHSLSQILDRLNDN